MLNCIKKFALTISKQSLVCVPHLPEAWGEPKQCYQNVNKKIQKDGGHIKYGWIFNLRTVSHINQRYLIAEHHVIWHNQNDQFINVTPFHDNPFHHPITFENTLPFLIDDEAPFVEIYQIIAPQPSKFYAMGDDERLIQHVQRITRKEEINYTNILKEALVLAGPPSD